MTDTQEAAVARNGVAEFDFGHLHIESATALFDMPWLGAEAALEMRPSTGENKQYTEAMLNISGARQASRILQGRKISTVEADQEREEDRAIYPGNVIVGWRGICNKTGDAVEFSVEACADLLKQLPDWIFLKIRLFAMAAENFITSPASVQPPPAAVAEN